MEQPQSLEFPCSWEKEQSRAETELSSVPPASPLCSRCHLSPGAPSNPQSSQAQAGSLRRSGINPGGNAANSCLLFLCWGWNTARGEQGWQLPVFQDMDWPQRVAQVLFPLPGKAQCTSLFQLFPSFLELSNSLRQNENGDVL